MSSTVDCTIDGCTWFVDGLRDAPDNTMMPENLAKQMGVPDNFFHYRWMMSEGERIEEAIADHLKTHTMLEALLTIKRLNDTMAAQAKDLEREKARTCQRICCTSR